MKIKVGIIGCGWFGNVHTDNLLKMDDVEIVAFTSTNKEKLEKIGQKVPAAHLYESHRDMFEREEKLDAVFICVPPDRHEDAEIIAAKKGIHFYVEKPIALSMSEARGIEKEIKKSGIITAVGYQERYNEYLEAAGKYFQNHPVGLINAKWFGGIPGAMWWRSKERSGGQVVEQSTHLVDLLRYLFGEVSTVYGVSLRGIVNNLPGYDTDDCSSTTITFRNGIIATLLSACYINEKEIDSTVGFQVLCSDSIVEYDFGRELRYITKCKTEKFTTTESTHFKAVQTFVQAVRMNSRDGIRSTYSDSIKTLEVTLAVNESIGTGKPVIIST